MSDSASYALISPLYPPPFVGGSSVWTRGVVEESELPFDVITGPAPVSMLDGPPFPDRTRIIRSRRLWNALTEDPTPKALLVQYFWIAVWFVRYGRRYTAVVAGTFAMGNGMLFLLGRVLGVPVIGLGFAEEFTIPLAGKGFKNALKARWIRWTHASAAGHIVVCDFCRDILVSIGVRQEAIAVVPPACGADKIRPRRAARGRGHHVLSVGRLVERKGFHLLVAAVARLRAEIPDIRLTIVGDGPYRAAVQGAIAREHAESFVEIAGRASDGELADLYGTADLFVLAHYTLPSGDTEGSPVVFAEASGSGLPVIGGTHGGASSIVDDGRTGFLVDPCDLDALTSRMRTLLLDAAVAEAMGRAGREKMESDHHPRVLGGKFRIALQRFAGAVSS